MRVIFLAKKKFCFFFFHILGERKENQWRRAKDGEIMQERIISISLYLLARFMIINFSSCSKSTFTLPQCVVFNILTFRIPTHLIFCIAFPSY